MFPAYGKTRKRGRSGHGGSRDQREDGEVDDSPGTSDRAAFTIDVEPSDGEVITIESGDDDEGHTQSQSQSRRDGGHKRKKSHHHHHHGKHKRQREDEDRRDRGDRHGHGRDERSSSGSRNDEQGGNRNRDSQGSSHSRRNESYGYEEDYDSRRSNSDRGQGFNSDRGQGSYWMTEPQWYQQQQYPGHSSWGSQDRQERNNNWGSQSHSSGHSGNRGMNDGGWWDRNREQNYNFPRNDRSRQYQQQDRRQYDRRQDGNFDNRRDHGHGRGNQSWEDYHEQQEQERIRISKENPNQVFLDDVNLNPEYGFRLDCRRNTNALRYRSQRDTDTAKYTYEGNLILGTSKEHFAKMFPAKAKWMYDPPVEMSEAETSKQTEVRREDISAESRPDTYLSLENKKGKGRKRYEKDTPENTNDFLRQAGEKSLRDKTIHYNTETSKNPTNIQLWKEFVQFQDQVFAESDQVFDNDGKSASGSKRNWKALVEKKVAILEKALETNKKSLELHVDKMNLLYEIWKPDDVLKEWQKLVAVYQQIAPFWIEYLCFAATQLQIYSISTITATFDKCFQKFRLMLNPEYPETQRPEKFGLFLADIHFGLSLLYKNSGYFERALSMHQVQLEIDFSCPVDRLEDKTLQDWVTIKKMFELYWDAGTQHFGEPDPVAWSDFKLGQKSKAGAINAVSDSQISDFEDVFFESVNSGTAKEDVEKSRLWLAIESNRSKLHWLPWRASCSDQEECDDAQRIVLATDLSPFVYAVPVVPFISEFDRQSIYFRHVINCLCTVREDFLPRTHTLDSIMSAFVSVSLSESRTLFNEVYYWKKYLQLYYTGDFEHKGIYPEGFKLFDFTTPTPNLVAELEGVPATFEIPTCPSDETAEAQNLLLKKNDASVLAFMRKVVDKCTDTLSAEFSCLLAEMWLRFEQKTINSSLDSHKIRIKFAKNLLRKEKLRNNSNLYKELAMLEFFGDKKDKAIELLIKTTNSSGKVLKENNADVLLRSELDADKITSLTALYRQLSEFFILDNSSLAFSIMVSLGNNFEPLKSLSVEDMSQQVPMPSNNVLLKAKNQFERILNAILGIESSDDESSERFWGGQNCIDFLVQKSNIVVEWTYSYGLFQYLWQGYKSSSQIFTKVLNHITAKEPIGRGNKYDADLVGRHHIREQLYMGWSKIVARELSQNLTANADFRDVLCAGLTEFPSSPPLLLILTDVENQCSIAGRLWRQMIGIVKQDSLTCSIHWAPLFMGLCLARKIDVMEKDEEVGLDDFGLGGPAVASDTIFYKLDSLLEAAEANSAARNCPLIWRMHLKLLAMRAKEGKDEKRALALFYNAIRHCPSVKSLYMDGVMYFPKLMDEVSQLFAQKEILVRLPVEELDVLLEIEDEKGEDKEKKRIESVSSSSSSDVEIIE